MTRSAGGKRLKFKAHIRLKAKTHKPDPIASRRARVEAGETLARFRSDVVASPVRR
jgi:hypothetical protein